MSSVLKATIDNDAGRRTQACGTTDRAIGHLSVASPAWVRRPAARRIWCQYCRMWQLL